MKKLMLLTFAALTFSAAVPAMAPPVPAPLPTFKGAKLGETMCYPRDGICCTLAPNNQIYCYHYGQAAPVNP